MRRIIFIAGTGTGIGKTTVAAALGYGFSQQGVQVGYWKPVSSGQPRDNEVIAEHAPSVKIFPSCYTYDTPISPHAAAVEEQKAAVNLSTLGTRLDKIQHRESFDLLLIEAAGGLLVPLNLELQTWLDFLALRSELAVVLVASSGLGTLNHTALSLRCLHDSGFVVNAIVMCGARFHDNEAIVRRLARDIPVHSLTTGAEFSASKDWSTQSHVLAQGIDDSLARTAETVPSWCEHDKNSVWHPFTRQDRDATARAIVKASGVWLEDSDGHRLIDGISSWWTNNLGHGREEVAHACAAQIRQCDHVAFAGLTHEPAAQLAHELIQLSEGHFARVFFSDNGSTAVEVALKTAFQYQRNRGQPQRDTFVALHGGYHGDTIGAMSVSALDRFRGEFSALLFESLRIKPVTSHPSAVCPAGANALQANLAACRQLLADNEARLCAIIVEPLVQGAAGMLMQEVAWLRAVSEMAAQHSIPLIFDEVFTACGRCGHTFAFQRAGIVPDIVCLAKGLTGGVLPLGLTLTKDKFFRSFVAAERAFMHGHTFTANPVICRAALTALAIAKQENINARALHLETCFTAWIAQQRTLLSNPRALGGILAFEVRDAEAAQALARTAATRQLFLRPLGNTIYFVPPLVISADELALAFSALEHALTELT